MTTNTEIKTWEARTPLCPSYDEITTAMEGEIAELRAALASQQGAVELPKLRDITQLVHDAGVMAPNESHYSVAITALVQRAASVPAEAVQQLPAGVTIRSFQAAHNKAWWIAIQHPFGSTNMECVQRRDIELAQLLAAFVSAASVQADNAPLLNALDQLTGERDSAIEENRATLIELTNVQRQVIGLQAKLNAEQLKLNTTVPQDIGRDAALEEAAKLVEKEAEWTKTVGGTLRYQALARAIRALAATPPANVAQAAPAVLSVAIADVLAERQRQIDAEGMERRYDDKYKHDELRRAAAVYAYPKVAQHSSTIWPWAASWMKFSTPRRDAVKAAALLIAEIERIDRAAAPQTTEKP